MPKNLNGVSYRVFGADRRLHLSIWGDGRLDIYVLWLIKRLWSVCELFSFSVESVLRNDDP